MPRDAYDGLSAWIREPWWVSLLGGAALAIAAIAGLLVQS